MTDALLEQCHTAVRVASAVHVSPAGFELLMNPVLRVAVEAYEEWAGLCPGSFASLAGARRVVFTHGAGPTFSLFCLSHFHRLDGICGVPSPEGSGGGGTIGG